MRSHKTSGSGGGRGAWVTERGLPSEVDVLVVGAGPAGATLANLLLKYRPETRVLVVERSEFPRYRIGQSLIVDINRVLEDMDLLETVDAAGFVRKYGSTFVWGADRTPQHFEWADFMEAGYPMPYTWHVPRPEFDALLVDGAVSRGAEVRFQHRVRDVLQEGDRVVGASVEDPAGAIHGIKARWVVDCGGQHGPLSRQSGRRRLDHDLKNVACYAYLKGVAWRDDWHGSQAHPRTAIINYDRGWFWVIPITEELTSVGFVTSQQAFREEGGGEDPEAFYHEKVRSLPEGQGIFDDATPVDYKGAGKLVNVVQELSYTCDRTWGPGWALCGDAAGFVDVILSTGVYLAAHHAQFLGYALRSVLDGLVDEEVALESYGTTVQENLSAYRSVAHMLYAFNPIGSEWWAHCADVLRRGAWVPDGDDPRAFGAFFTGFATREGLYDDALQSFGGDFMLEMGRRLGASEALFSREHYEAQWQQARRMVTGNPRLRIQGQVSARTFGLPRHGTGRLWPVIRFDFSSDEVGAGVGFSRRLHAPLLLADAPVLMDGTRRLSEIARVISEPLAGVVDPAGIAREVAKLAYRFAMMGVLERVDDTLSPSGER